jgi:hypothetical protein
VTIKTIIASVAAFSLTAGPSFGQQADDGGALQQHLSDLQACVRSHAAEVYALGIRATGDAEEHLIKRCISLNDLFASTKLSERPVPKVPALRPGILRITVREEWAAFLNAASGR